jgi:uroporphyrinogen decarboxylase
MTGLERLMAAVDGQVRDVVPCAPFAGFSAARIIGIPVDRYVTDGTLIARAQIELQKAIGHDAVVTAGDTYYLAEGFGLQVTHHANALPTSNGPLLESLSEVDQLSVPDPDRDGRMPVYLEAINLLARELGERVAIRGTGTGPFSLAAYLYGDQRFLMKLAEISAGMVPSEDEKGVHQLLEICAVASAAFLRAQIRRGENIAYLGDSLASEEMISPCMYRTYAQPYQRMVFEMIADDVRRYGARTLLHICGNNSSILRDLASTGADIIEIDQKLDLAWCRAELGSAACLIGNLDPVQIVMNATPERVAEESTACIQAAGQNSRFILGTGCFVPLEAPFDNLKAMVKAAHSSPCS